MGGPPPKPAKILCYTFGCPRVGNKALADQFNGLNIEAYRIVNGADIVARLPRHGNAVGGLLDYEHCGKTVLVSEEFGKESVAGVIEGAIGAEMSGYWVESETDNQPCPLREGTPLVDPLADGALLFEALRDGVRSQNPFAAVGRLKDLTPTQATSLVGLDPRFVEAELQLMDALRTGRGC
mmetsp:Transcript_41176/g.109932  ORF Transcript_41176/g.109932 Transcript_41176/m.109932 type:complete len:181 (-) Transcript_41176:46-588(-)